MSQLSAESSVAISWFTRDGDAVPAHKVHSIDVSKGKGHYTYTPHCDRCGGLGRSEAWAHTGYTCFKCGGSCKGQPRTNEVFLPERLEALNASLEKRRAKAKAKADALEAARLEALQAPWLVWVNDHAQTIAEMREIAASSDFIKSLLLQIDGVHMLTPNQLNAAHNNIERASVRAQERAKSLASKWIGEVGERRNFTLTVNYIMDWSKPDQYPPIFSYLHVCTDAEGNIFKYVGNSSIIPGVGETFTVKATVTKHDHYEGVKQTQIARPAIPKTKE